MNWNRKWLLDLDAGKTLLVSSDWSKNTGAVDVKMDGSVREEKSSLKRLGLTLSSKLHWISYIVSIAKAVTKKIGAFLLRLLCISINLPYDYVWNTVVISGLVLLDATWNGWISYKSGYAGFFIYCLS